MFNLIFIMFFLLLDENKANYTEIEDREWMRVYHEEPMYFLLGTPNTKIKFSLKAKVFSATNIYVAYSQRIFWDIFKTSSPFRDVNYNPYFFYRFHLYGDSKSLIDIIAFEHESNGGGSEKSRSWDQIGIRYQTAVLFNNDYKLTWSIQAWVPFNIDNTNANIAEYRGVYEVIFTLSNFMGSYFELNDLSLRFYSGGKMYINPLRGGRELTLKFKGRSPIFLTNIVFQIFQGYGENMLEYNKSIWSFRAGIGI